MAGPSDHLLDHFDEYLLDGVHQAGLDAMGMFIGMFFNLALHKMVQRMKVGRVRRPQTLGMMPEQFLANHSTEIFDTWQGAESCGYAEHSVNSLLRLQQLLNSRFHLHYQPICHDYGGPQKLLVPLIALYLIL